MRSITKYRSEKLRGNYNYTLSIRKKISFGMPIATTTARGENLSDRSKNGKHRDDAEVPQCTNKWSTPNKHWWHPQKLRIIALSDLTTTNRDLTRHACRTYTSQGLACESLWHKIRYKTFWRLLRLFWPPSVISWLNVWTMVHTATFEQPNWSLAGKKKNSPKLFWKWIWATGSV